ncbi:outer membrane usher protein [Providencia sp. Me31A]|uniref:outer membrane usher protein n=1 Tax=Providencia sp. Me31A TaxID=3392637 RepID=UPI003D27542C
MAGNNVHFLKPFKTKFKLIFLLVGISISLNAFSDEIEFNSDMLDVSDRANINLKQFAKPGYLMPGEYRFTIHVNESSLTDEAVFYYPDPENSDDSTACISPEVVKLLALKPDYVSKLTWWHDNQCLDLNSVPGTTVRADLPKSAFYISVPQAYLEYTADNWDPPSRWEEGINGFLFDYNMNTQFSQQTRASNDTAFSLNANGVTGFNMGVWRFRSDWQARVNKTQGQDTENNFEWTRYYAYRAIKSLGAQLALGENYFTSDIFDSFRFAGASLATDDSMLPPNLRGYAPEVTGVARSNATVIISQQGHVIYQTQVAAGPFRIQDLNDALSGDLDVTVEEQDGTTQNFTVSTANIPYLTRPGQVRYKVAAGRPTDYKHHSNGKPFASGEFSWGIDNGWSLFGGSIMSDKYLSAALGIGRDLMVFGALSLDVTHSRAKLNNMNDGSDDTYRGNSYRLSYSKRFDDYNSQVTFAGYRFSEKGFMSMSEFLDTLNSGERKFNSKEMYTVSYNQQFTDLGISVFLNYYHQSYWDRKDSDRYSLSLAKYFDIGRFKNISLNLTAFRNRANGTNDDGVYTSVSVPWGNQSSLSLSNNWSKDNTTNQANFYSRIDQGSSYSLNTGWSRDGSSFGGTYNYDGSLAAINTNATYQHNRYRAAAFGIQGGITATREGVALHRVNQMGGTRMVVSTDGVPDIPVQGFGASVYSNPLGYAVIGDINSYYRNQVRIDVNKLPDTAAVSQSIKQGTLTEGAIGYRKFDVVSGAQAMAVIRLADNQVPPFGSVVINGRKQQVGIVGDDGNVYLTGLRPHDVLEVSWNEGVQCQIRLPSALPDESVLMSKWLLPCPDNIQQATDSPKLAADSPKLSVDSPKLAAASSIDQAQTASDAVVEVAPVNPSRWLLK